MVEFIHSCTNERFLPCQMINRSFEDGCKICCPKQTQLSYAQIKTNFFRSGVWSDLSLYLKVAFFLFVSGSPWGHGVQRLISVQQHILRRRGQNGSPSLPSLFKCTLLVRYPHPQRGKSQLWAHDGAWHATHLLSVYVLCVKGWKLHSFMPAVVDLIWNAKQDLSPLCLQLHVFGFRQEVCCSTLNLFRQSISRLETSILVSKFRLIICNMYSLVI